LEGIEGGSHLERHRNELGVDVVEAEVGVLYGESIASTWNFGEQRRTKSGSDNLLSHEYDFHPNGSS